MKAENNLYWYGIQCISGGEDVSRKQLQKVFPEFETLLPQRILFIRKGGITRKETKALFPGYFFIKTKEKLQRQQSQEIIHKVNLGQTPLLLRILGKNDSDFLTNIPSEEMGIILELTAEGEEIGVSRVAKENHRFRILSGPLKDREVMIKKINARKKRITVELNLLGEIREIQLGAEISIEEID